MAIYWYFYINLIISIPTWTTLTFFVLISLLHVQITLSHFGMSTADLGPDESFAQKTAAHDDGYRLSAMAGLGPSQIAVPGCASSFPTCAET
jgi:hypothetical protein